MSPMVLSDTTLLLTNKTFKNNSLMCRAYLGHTPSTAGTFRKKFRRKDPENTLRAFPGIPYSAAGSPKPYNSRHLRLPKNVQNSLSPRLFFRNGSGEGLSELVMEFPAVPGVLLNIP